MRLLLSIWPKCRICYGWCNWSRKVSWAQHHLSSLLYKKHPAEIKFVLVDPKKVELTLYNKIERHYLAKLPDVEDAIITDNRQVINTLNSLCIEMDNRYNMLKNAMCRNIKEYNKRFKKRELNPNDGHAFSPIWS